MSEAGGYPRTPVCGYCDDASVHDNARELAWAAKPMTRFPEDSSPACAYHLLLNNAKHLTNSGKKITLNALRSLTWGNPLPFLMDEEDAKMAIKDVAKKVNTRAAKRRAEDEKAAVAAHKKAARIGAARAAKRARIFARPVPTKRLVLTTGRVYMY
jgi:hypothetical protein